MQALADKLNTIELKVKRLAQKMEQVQQENAAFKEENKKLKTDLAVMLEKGGQAITTPVAPTVPVVAKKSGEKQLNTKKLKKEIEQYIKEINKCIEWLQNT